MTLGHFLRAAAICGGPEERAMLQRYLERRLDGVQKRKPENAEGTETARAVQARTALNSQPTLRREP